MREPNPDDMLERMSSRHLTEWFLLMGIHKEEEESGEAADEIGPNGEIIERSEGEDEEDDEDDNEGE